MPELPEVETIVNQLKPAVLAQRILKQQVFDDKLKHLRKLKLTGSSIKNLRRVGKQIVFALEGGAIKYLAIHLRMTGSLLWELSDDNSNSARETGIPSQLNSETILVNHQRSLAKHLRWSLKLETGSLKFYDIRRFGTIIAYDSLEEILKCALDPLDSKFSLNYLADICKKTLRPIKLLLLDQSKLVGIGNIYASEILFRSSLNPQRPAESLDSHEVARLFNAIQEVLSMAIKHNGTTFSDYRDSKGESGGFQHLLSVYNRDGLECKKCGTPISRIVQAQRSTFFCPRCQSMSDSVSHKSLPQ